MITHLTYNYSTEESFGKWLDKHMDQRTFTILNFEVLRWVTKVEDDGPHSRVEWREAAEIFIVVDIKSGISGGIHINMPRPTPLNT